MSAGAIFLPPAWLCMWLLAGAIYGCFKWLTWRQARAAAASAGPARSLGYLLLWPGMDAQEFLSPAAPARHPSLSEWLAAFLKTVFGATMFWVVARRVPPEAPLLSGWVGPLLSGWVGPLLSGWVGMIGLIFLLHFGFFHIIALAWQRSGVQAAPIMRAPARAASLSEFWGARWNLGFRQLAHELIFVPTRRRLGASGAAMLVFLFSGVIHDLVISLPASGGYGRPTAYFLLQGLGVMLERSNTGRRLGLGGGWRGRLFTLLVTAAPVFWLFHPPFVTRVMLPLMRAMGAL